jgi:hypothetical protein
MSFTFNFASYGNDSSSSGLKCFAAFTDSFNETLAWWNWLKIFE